MNAQQDGGAVMTSKTLVMEGRLEEFALPSILQVLSIGRQFTAVELTDPESATIGSITIKSGQIVNANLRQRGGVDAFFDLFAVSLHQFRVYRMPTPTRLPKPLGAIGPLLVKALKQRQKRKSAQPAREAARSSAQPPALPVARTKSSNPAPKQEAAMEPTTNVHSFPPTERSGNDHDRRILAICSPKGGVGKTTVTLNLALSIARQGRHVIVADADINGDIMSAVDGRDRVRVGVHDLLDSVSFPDEALIRTVLPNLKILPSCGPDVPASAFESRDRMSQWKSLLGQLSQRADVVLVDTPAGMFDVTKQLLPACTHVLGIVQCEVIARRSFSPNFLRGLDLLGASRPEVAGVLLNMFQRDQASSVSVLQDIASSVPAEWLLDTTIPRTPAFLEAAEQGLPLRLLDDRAPPSVTWLFEMLATEVAGRLGVQKAVAQPRNFLA